MIVMDKEELIRQAWLAREMAFAPYSKFFVGSALLGESGRIYFGCNVENISLGLTMCAERVCIGAAIAAGERQFEIIAIAADSQSPVAPCGACRQVMAEFSPELRIISTTLDGTLSEFKLSDLLPIPRQGIWEEFHVEHVHPS